MFYTETKCLTLGDDPLREKELVVRWDHIWDFFATRPELLQHCSLSAIVVKDKQDPSLVTDLTCLYKYFLSEGYLALGMYLKCTHFLCEAFLDKELSPMERVYKAYYAKAFFYKWFHNNKKKPHNTITSETFHDVCCCVDGLIDYLLMLMKKFPNAPVVTFYLGSDICEQIFAFIRISRYSGRRTNLDADILSYGLERRNVCSLLTDDTPQFAAHTRGRCVLKDPIPLPEESLPEKSCRAGLFYGRDILESDIKNTIKNAINDCFIQCHGYGFNCFNNVSLNEIPRNSSYVSPHNINEDDCDEIDDIEDLNNEDEELCNEEATVINTPMGRMHIRTAESIFLNGGKMKIPAKSRKSRFYADIFEGNYFVSYKESVKCCPSSFSRGDKVTLSTFKDSKIKVCGIVRYISVQHTPLKYACKKHKYNDKLKHLNVWLYIKSSKEYVRCIY